MSSEATAALSLDQLVALSSPLRVAIFGAFRLLGPQTVKVLAEYLRTKPDALYYHLRILVAVGLLEVQEIRPVYKRKEAVYRLTSRHFVIASLEGNPKYGEAVMRLVEASASYGLGSFRQAALEKENSPEPEFHLVHGRLRSDSLARWKQDLEKTMQAGFRDEGEDGIPVMACAMVVPV